VRAGSTAASSPCRAASAILDVDLAATALREANEELGLAGDQVELLAALPVVQTQTTGFRIAPFLARPEVAAEEVRAFPTWPPPRRIRLWRVGRHEVWGVTYRILEPLVPRLLGGEWRL
jgi:8-oxo-dGTP pyrophosphatase MutT (NUDIX family)